jgi:hypothetical protein
MARYPWARAKSRAASNVMLMLVFATIAKRIRFSIVSSCYVLYCFGLGCFGIPSTRSKDSLITSDGYLSCRRDYRKSETPSIAAERRKVRHERTTITCNSTVLDMLSLVVQGAVAVRRVHILIAFLRTTTLLVVCSFAKPANDSIHGITEFGAELRR